jgi:hypothetical protein
MPSANLAAVYEVLETLPYSSELERAQTCCWYFLTLSSGLSVPGNGARTTVMVCLKVYRINPQAQIYHCS